jgi:hypothetical protein
MLLDYLLRDAQRGWTPNVCLTLAAWLLLMGFTGCGDANFGQVSGVVRLDGEPLADASVEFQPLKGSPSFGTTDAQGRYSLLFSPSRTGASVGTHTVRITTFRVEGEGPSTKIIKERVPKQYNAESKEIHEVKSGKQTINFEIATPAKK